MDPSILLVAGLAVILLLQFLRVRRQQREARSTRDALEVGAEVLTASGMVGTVVEASGATVVLAGEDGQRTRWVAGAVVRVLTDTDPVSSRYRAPDAASEQGGRPAGSPGTVDLRKAPGDDTVAPGDADHRGDTAAGTPTKD